MARRKVSVFTSLIALCCTPALGACSAGQSGGGAEGSGVAENTSLKERIKVLEAENAQLKSKLEIQASQSVATAAATTSVGLPSAGLTLPAKAPSSTVVSFCDLDGCDSKDAIVAMQSLGIFEPITIKFEREKPASRREYVKWLVKTTNILLERANLPDKRIRLSKGTTSSFTDLAKDDPDLPLIEGLLAAGIAVGYEDHTFRPEKAISREEMFSIKGALNQIVSYGKGDLAGATGDWYYYTVYTDGPSVPRSLAGGLRVAYNDGEIGRIYGTIKTLKPKQPVTRAEAALCASVLGSSREWSVLKLGSPVVR